MLHGPELDAGVLVEKLEQPPRADRARGDDLVPVRSLARARDDALLDEVDEPIREQLRVNAELAVAIEQPQHGVRHGADASLERRTVRDTFGDQRCDATVDVRRGARGQLNHRSVRGTPAGELAHVQLVLPERARHQRVHFDEKGDLADERCRILGVAAEREVAVPVGRGDRGDDERGRERPHQPRHLAEAVGHQVARAPVERVAARGREEPRYVAQTADLALDVAAFAERQHLVETDVLEPSLLRLDGIEHGARLAVADADDHVGAIGDVVQHRLGWALPRGELIHGRAFDSNRPPGSTGRGASSRRRAARHVRSSVFLMTADPCSMSALMSPTRSLGSRSAIQTNRLRPAPSANTCADALWCVKRPPTTDQTTHRLSSSTSTISSRATVPLPKVTIRAPSSSRVSTTKPGTSLVWSAPTSRSAAQTSSGRASIEISLRMEAIVSLSFSVGLRPCGVDGV